MKWRTAAVAGLVALGMLALAIIRLPEAPPAGPAVGRVGGVPETRAVASRELASTALATTVATRFPRGHVRYAPPYEPLPPGPVREYLPGLLSAANATNATAEANLRAFHALNACRFQATQMRARTEQKERVARGEKAESAADSPGPDCVGVTEKDWADSMRYLKRAAELGDDRAIYQYASGLPLFYLEKTDLIAHPEAVLEWRQDSARMLIGASESGSLDAMLGLVDAYETGRLGEKNPELAYQYLFAFRELSGRDINITRLSDHLNPEEVSRAQQGARALIARCCKTR